MPQLERSTISRVRSDASRCGMCGRKLTSSLSRQRGLGPKCHQRAEEALNDGGCVVYEHNVREVFGG